TQLSRGPRVGSVVNPFQRDTMKTSAPVARPGSSHAYARVSVNGNGHRNGNGRDVDVLARVRQYPRLRFMGSKYRLLPWIHDVLRGLSFDTALDAFTGSGAVGYLMKAMGKAVTAN